MPDFRTKVRRRPDGSARWDVWINGRHVAGNVERDQAAAMRQTADYLRANDPAASPRDLAKEPNDG